MTVAIARPAWQVVVDREGAPRALAVVGAPVDVVTDRHRNRDARLMRRIVSPGWKHTFYLDTLEALPLARYDNAREATKGHERYTAATVLTTSSFPGWTSASSSFGRAQPEQRSLLSLHPVVPGFVAVGMATPCRTRCGLVLMSLR